MIKIGNHIISKSSEPFIIAEAGINHNGEIEKAFEMIQLAKDSGANCVKFQTFKADEFVGDFGQMFTYKSQGNEITESMLTMFKRYEFSEYQWSAIKDKCDEIGITFMSTPQNKTDLDLLLKIGIPAIKVGSDDFTNIPLMKEYSKTGLPMFISMGMSDLAEVYQTLSIIGSLDSYPTVLFLCTSQYPTPKEDVNLLKLKTLAGAFPELILGFSDHTQGPQASSLAVAMGATVFEKHFTLNNDLPGPDHWFSEDPEGLKSWIIGIRESFAILGSPVVRPSNKELSMRVLARRSITALEDIPSGSVLNIENVGLRRPGNGMPPSFLDNVIGHKSNRLILKNELLNYSDIT